MELQKHHKPTFDNISAEKRQRILNTATGEFAAKGFDNANMNTIAQKADVSVGSLYKYFENKQDLFLTVIQYSIQSMEELLSVLAVSQEDILVKVERIIREIQHSSKENAMLMKLYNGMTAESNPRFASQFAYEMEALTASIYRQAIEEGQKNGEIRTVTNNHGGILGGITSGMPVVFRVAMKPTPSIAKEQQSVNLETKTEESLKIVGRHDPCIVPRAVPVVEAVTAITVLDMLLGA